jgi:hypothetical protein
MARTDLYRELQSSVPGKAVQTIALQGAWPTLSTVEVEPGRVVQVALHLSTVGSHARKPHEFRFQNPAQRPPVQAPAGFIPILVGVWGASPGPLVLVAVNGQSRVGRNARFSILFNRSILDEAAKNGWATYISHSGEKIVSFSAENLPLYIAAIQAAAGNEAALATLADEVGTELIPVGQAPAADDIEKKRRWANAMRAVRSGVFSSKVLSAYGRKCSMCGIGDPLIQAAHVHPVAASDSQDVVSNGIALCANHHLLFDAHLLAIEPSSKRILRAPRLNEMVASNPALHLFVKSTATTLAEPVDGTKLDLEMVKRRHSFFASEYGWIAT